MKITNPSKVKNKKLFVFDLDDTLAESKTPMDQEMAGLIKQLLEKKKMAVIGGGKYEIFKWQFISQLNIPKKLLENLHLFPTSGNAYYRYKSGWKNVYSHNLTTKEKKQIRDAFEEVYKEINYKHPKKVYGEILEDRKSQMSFSPLGQDIVTVLGKKGLKMKEDWRKKYDSIRHQIAKLLSKKLPNLEVRVGGITTIDVTMKGIDKAYGVRQMEKHLKIKIKDMFFVGDAIFPGGNDYAVLKTGIDYMPIKSSEETKQIIRKVLE
ncbi:MAG TPA: HAD-IIB family hydrolase [Candidatus Doudnabacteria bacterium]|nr:HAD-IIB family hydrolase [Candidatus Doudnabacteria bacterium]